MSTKLPSKLLGTSSHKIAEFYFRTNDDQLEQPDLRLTSELGAFVKARLKRGEKVDLFFVGNCDHTGRARYNERLAMRRAKSVRKSVVSAAGGWGRILNNSLFESNLIAARSLGESRANQNATTPNELAADRRVDVWQQNVKVKISIPEEVLERRRKLLVEIARMERLIADAKQHAVLEGSRRYEASEYAKDMKRMRELVEGTQSKHPIERRVDARVKRIVIRELEKVVERRQYELNDLQARLRMVDREIASYNRF